MSNKADHNTQFSALAGEIIQLARIKKLSITTAESCTGGLIMAALTDIAGSSSVVDRGFITYTNKSKMQTLGVAASTLRENGAVSEATAGEMAHGALSRSASHITVAVTGIAGPGGGSVSKPVGMVCFGLATRSKMDQEHSVSTQTIQFGDQGRAFVRAATVEHAMAMIKGAMTARH